MPDVIQEGMKSLQIKGMHNTNYFLGITENTSNISNKKSEDFMAHEGNFSSKSKELMGHPIGSYPVLNLARKDAPGT